jgi:hypothetical protein
LWPVRQCVGSFRDKARASYTCSMLSFPPVASWLPEGDHARPHTSCECPVSVL